jgi:hypothetical protein
MAGTEYELSLAGSNLVAAPRWVMEGSRNPRLLPGKAVSLARREVTKKFAAAASWNIDSICMESYPETIPGGANALCDRWYYQIEFQPAGWKAGDDHYRVWVLMDGRVILPKPKKATDVEPAAPNTAPPRR